MEDEKEFGGGITKPTNGWLSLSKPFEISVAAGPLILFKPRKLSASQISKSRLTTVSYNINKIVESENSQIGTALDSKGGKTGMPRSGHGKK